MRLDGPVIGRDADILLADGSTARVRQIAPSDSDALLRLHQRLSERTRYLRYFAATPRIPPRDLHRLVNVDHHEREAFVVELAGEIIAVAQYARVAPRSREAEVAFLVEDGYQRRGLGSVLLEHLVAAARQEGFGDFVADVLPVNRTMLRVFANAGYPVTQRYLDGLVHLSFPIAPTSRSRAAQRAREHRAEVASVSRLLAPRAVALYGARADGTGFGAALLRHLRADFAGRVCVVHPTASAVDGRPALRTLTEAGTPVDLAVVAVPAEAVPAVVADCAAAGVHGLVVVSAGFSDSGPDRACAVDQLARQVRDHGMRLVGPNCLGIANTAPTIRLTALLAPQPPEPGQVGMFCRSSALGTALLGEAQRRGLGLSSFVSVGDQSDVCGSDLLRYWRDDPATELVLLSLETWGNRAGGEQRRFARTAREVAARKPVIAAVSPAITPAGTPAGTTAANPSAGPATVSGGPGPDERGIAALFAASGVIQVGTVRELFDVAQVLAGQPLPKGNRLAVVTNAAALAALAEASAPGAGLRAAVGYPLDLGPAADSPVFVAATRRALADPGVDSLVVAYASPLADDRDVIFSVARSLKPAVISAGKPMITVFPGVVEYPSGVPTFRGVEEAVAALGRASTYGAWRSQPPGVVPVLADVDNARARRVFASLAAAGGAVGVEALLECYGIRVGAAPGQRRGDQPGPDRPAGQYRAAAGGPEWVVEVVDDPAFGKVIGFGLGGLASELVGDRAWRPAPLTDTEATALLGAPRAAPLLSGYAGSPPADQAALADLLVRVGRLADDHPRLRRIVLNPVLAHPVGYSVLGAIAQTGETAGQVG